MLLDRFRLEDMAIKVVGVGSVGTRCGVLLLTGGPNDQLFLQVKEALPSVLEPYAGKSAYAESGVAPVVIGQRLMQAGERPVSGLDPRSRRAGTSTCVQLRAT